MERYNGKISLDDLYKQKKQNNDNKTITYNRILKRIHTKIKLISRQKNNMCFCAYVIHEFVLGLPRYDVAACTAHIIQKLKENGFLVKYTYPNLLFISWGHYIPSYQRDQYRKQTGQTIDEHGNIISRNDFDDINSIKGNMSNRGNKDSKRNDYNALLLKNKNGGLSNKNKITTFKNISNYKPTGKFIYSNDVLNKIEDNIRK